MAHNGLSNEINAALDQMEKDGGVWLKDIPEGSYALIETRNTMYKLSHLKDGSWEISGNKRFCPNPCKVMVNGSTFGGSMLRIGWIGMGMHLELYFPSLTSFSVVTTTQIQKVTVHQ